MSSSVITTGGFLPGSKTAPIIKSADLIAFTASSVPLIIVEIFSPYLFLNPPKFSRLTSIAVTEAPI